MLRNLIKSTHKSVQCAQPRFFSHAISQHINTPFNNKDTPFEFTDASNKKIKEVLAKFPTNYKDAALMPLLFIAQEQNNNWLPISAMDKVASMLDMPPMRVYEVATFFTMYNREPVGKYHIQVCGTTTCMCMGAQDIKKVAMDFAGVHHEGEVSKDGNFCVVEVECLGACTNAPMVQVNNHEFYENLTPTTMHQLMQDLLVGKAKVGPQNGQMVAEGPQGQTTLQGYKNSHPQFRDIDALLSEKKKADAEAAEAKKKAEAEAAEAKKKADAEAKAAAAPAAEKK